MWSTPPGWWCGWCGAGWCDDVVGGVAHRCGGVPHHTTPPSPALVYSRVVFYFHVEIFLEINWKYFQAEIKTMGCKSPGMMRQKMLFERSNVKEFFTLCQDLAHPMPGLMSPYARTFAPPCI